MLLQPNSLPDRESVSSSFLKKLPSHRMHLTQRLVYAVKKFCIPSRASTLSDQEIACMSSSLSSKQVPCRFALQKIIHVSLSTGFDSLKEVGFFHTLFCCFDSGSKKFIQVSSHLMISFIKACRSILCRSIHCWHILSLD